MLNLLSRGLRTSKTAKRSASTFAAAKLKELGKPMEITEVKAPKKLEKEQVRIKVNFCSVNASDVLLTQGQNPGNFKLPITPGYEVAGTVLESQSPDFLKGDRVVALNKDQLGGFAEECVAHSTDVWAVPPNVPLDLSAALADSFGTAMLGLVRRGHLSENQIVLTTMASTHGYASVDLAAQVFKAKVIAVCTSEAESEKLRERGAWNALVYNEKLLLSTVKELTNGQGVDVIYDTLAGDALATCLKCVKHEGHVVVAGYTLKELPQIQISQLLTLPSFNISGVSLTSYRRHAPEVYRQAVSDALEMKEQGLISPKIAAKFPLEQVNKALEFIRETEPVGKVVLDMTQKKETKEKKEEVDKT
ncbi:Alcohol dehydrogenase GroES-like domain [Nesidiocoris tenuis]|uniref:Alcohol dehydrogenase GroES-like domain n=1 Tax=Nesidiocoris tenuis TaxID=355587 RepID=A0ABN7BBV5_9HEMI|nr:Alcohol dehydrogenase GroES-like domain [Nesidiocoris tenuis]